MCPLRWPVWIGIALIALGGVVVGRAHAHAEIARCEPPIGATLDVPPTQIRCWFTQELDPKGSTMTVLDAAGRPVDRGDAHVDLNDPDRKQMVVSLDPTRLLPGTYTVRWHTRSAEDGEETGGTFSLTVRGVRPTATAPFTPTIPPSPTALVPPTATPTLATPTPSAVPAFPPEAPRIPIGAVLLAFLIGVAAVGGVLGWARRR
jgi:methionine-rich copper-binding protein CopC